jgi:putative ubiquitin-RnfH superfamily antitoxin RatB of RatAB toxin-antitoxin module
LSDRKLVAIDEFSELDPEDFGKITEARTTGVLKVDRVVNTETNARVRMLLLTNPAHSGVHARTLKSFTHGVESLKPLFASPADIRRLDLAVFLQSGDVPQTVLNAEYPKPSVQLVQSNVLRDSILWAWSRKAQDITITDKAMKIILKQSDYLAEKYGYAQDIPLMEPADLRKKLARMAIAMAAFVHSTDETHTKVIVNPEHVQAVVDFISIVYDDDNCRFDIYSAKSKEESELTEEERVEIKKAMEDLDFGDNSPVSEEILDLFKKNDILKPSEIIDMLGYERSQVNTRLAILTKHSMIKRTREGLRKLPKFIEYLLLQ